MKKKVKKQHTLFNDSELESWRKEWQDMPEFIQREAKPFQTIKLYFNNKKDVKEFSKLIKQKLTEKTKYIWYPKVKLIEEKEIGRLSNKRYIDES